VANDPTTNTAAVNAQIAQDAQSNASNLDAPASDVVDMEAMRATLDQRIDQDLASGTLSSSDAVAVRLTLDEIDAQTADTQVVDNNAQANAASSTRTGSTDEVQGGTTPPPPKTPPEPC
jgi:predicted secreted protein